MLLQCEAQQTHSRTQATLQLAVLRARAADMQPPRAAERSTNACVTPHSAATVRQKNAGCNPSPVRPAACCRPRARTAARAQCGPCATQPCGQNRKIACPSGVSIITAPMYNQRHARSAPGPTRHVHARCWRAHAALPSAAPQPDAARLSDTRPSASKAITSIRDQDATPATHTHDTMRTAAVAAAMHRHASIAQRTHQAVLD